MTDGTRIRALSGKPVDGLTVEAVRAGEVGVTDLRIHPETLERQAVVAEQHGNPQLAENLRRAAELTRLPDDEVLAIYEALRPGRSTPAQLTELAASLDTRGKRKVDDCRAMSSVCHGNGVCLPGFRENRLTGSELMTPVSAAMRGRSLLCSVILGSA